MTISEFLANPELRRTVAEFSTRKTPDEQRERELRFERRMTRDWNKRERRLQRRWKERCRASVGE